MPWRWPFEKTTETHGGYSLFAIVTVRDGVEDVYKTHLRADKAIKLARAVWANNQPLDEVWCVNMKLGTRTDVISRETNDCPECSGRWPGYCPVCKCSR